MSIDDSDMTELLERSIPKDICTFPEYGQHDDCFIFSKSKGCAMKIVTGKLQKRINAATESSGF